MSCFLFFLSAVCNAFSTYILLPHTSTTTTTKPHPQTSWGELYGSICAILHDHMANPPQYQEILNKLKGQVTNQNLAANC